LICTRADKQKPLQSRKIDGLAVTTFEPPGSGYFPEG
jgi:hypothetical protein